MNENSNDMYQRVRSLELKIDPTDDKNRNLGRFLTWNAKGCTFVASFFLVSVISIVLAEWKVRVY